ncbi:MAG: site-2 protease family protein [bacterium]|nr:site-2 protease family protein [bacterium]
MDDNSIPEIVSMLRKELSDILEEHDVSIDKYVITFRGKPLLPPEETFSSLRSRLERLGFLPYLRKEKEEVLIRVTKSPQGLKKSNPLVNLILFLLTILTTLFAGTLHQGENPFQDPKKLYLGIPFSFSLLLILLAHELGHYFMCKHHGVKATLPYFLPVPHPLIGTFGAFIKIRSPVFTKQALMDIGAAGPLAGFILSVPIVIIGLKLSKVVAVSNMKEAITLGDSIIFRLLCKLVLGPLQANSDIILHQVAFAGWIGLLVTSLNLLPVGQLDGGHIAYSLFGRRQKTIAKITILSLLAMSLKWPGWFFWTFLILLLGFHHPRPLDDITPLNTKRKMIGVLALLILILSFIPVPFGITK